jgi:hypothetical protein
MAANLPGDPNCICQGTGLTTRLTGTGNTGPEVCGCVAKQGADQERQRLKEALLSEDVRREIADIAANNGDAEDIAQLVRKLLAARLDTLEAGHG